jgi:two-component system CheB/CheR fusion protein
MKQLLKSLKNKPLKSTKQYFPIVGIGASAGGLEAVTSLIKSLPDNLGMAFIYVQHLSSDHESMLAIILSKKTKMKVQEVKNAMLIEPNNFYVIPPGKEMTITDGHIRLTPRKKDKNPTLSIDAFFTSLAETHKENVIGIVLSGSANDGTRGLKAIKQEGGLTFAQDSSAEFKSMPESAIAEGVVDFVLSPKQIAAKLVLFSKNNFRKNAVLKVGQEDEIENSHPDLKTILQILYRKEGVDFSHYKMNTIKRRIIRRMALHKIKKLKEYVKQLGQKDNEVELLYQDLLINVTNFFRDADAFRFLKTTLLPRLLKQKQSGETLRIWIPACSTGEEAYSIAMIILEIQGSKSTNIPVQIFATDLSEQVINKARNGEYSEHELESISVKRINQFFTKSKDRYRIAKPLRDMCVFAQHNILRDPPFSHIDFVSCCNVLIYLDNTAQKKALATFHYALNDGGCLMLGKSETTGSATQLFVPVNKKFKIYTRKKNSGKNAIPYITPRFSQTVPKKTTHIPKTIPISSNGTLAAAIDSIILAHYMPACVVINLDMEIVEFRGSTSLYLENSSGKASFNILKMARPEFAFDLRNAIYNAIKTKKVTRKSGIEIKINSTIHIVNIEVSPIKIEGEEPFLLVLFTEQQKAEIYINSHLGHSSDKSSSATKDRRIKKLEEELATARSDMHSITHDQESINEELQSANEEVVSNNEELRTLNEELETSKEEIESTNEELVTTNRELNTRNDQIEELNKYSEAIIATIHNPMIILDKNFSIKSANSQFHKSFHIKDEVIEGAKFFELNNNEWNIPVLRNTLKEIVSKNINFHTFEITHLFKGIGKKTLSINAKRVILYNNKDLQIMISINDITEQTDLRLKEKKLYLELQQANDSLKAMNEELTSFNYIASHDLQEPIRKIQGFTKLIIEKEQHNLSDAGKDYFVRIQQAGIRMKSLIDDLLTYSYTTNLEKRFEKTDLNKIVEDVKNDLKEVISQKNATIQVNKLAVANIIPIQFYQLMHNLIGNALKFSSPKRQPHIIIKSELVHGNTLKNKNASPKTTYCHISVADNGIGFDPQYKDRIFEVFQRLHSYEEFKGTGIGLAICKKVVENHKGFITADSQLNKGSRFDIYIPSTGK